MKVALPLWNGKVATVFDFAHELVVYTIDEEGIRESCCHPLADGGFACRLHLLQKEDVDVLICGAISRQMHKLLQQTRIELHSNVCGPIEAVLNAWQEGNLSPFRFRCHRKRKGCRCQRGLAAVVQSRHADEPPS